MKTAESLTAERGQKYGPPIDEFSTEYEMMDAWTARRDSAMEGSNLNERQEMALRQAVSMCIVKLVRAAQSPDVKDHWDDLQGYARCAKMIMCLEK